jgi:hypothetical protein
MRNTLVTTLSATMLIGAAVMGSQLPLNRKSLSSWAMVNRKLIRIRNLIRIRITTMSFTAATQHTAIIHFPIHIPTTTLLFLGDTLNTVITMAVITTSLIEAPSVCRRNSLRLSLSDLIANTFLFCAYKLEKLEAAGFLALRTSSWLSAYQLDLPMTLLNRRSLYRTTRRWREV